MKASQTQATSPKVSSPFQRCPEGKWRSRIAATFSCFKVASRTGMSSTRSTRCTCAGSVLMPSLLCLYPFPENPSDLSRTAGLMKEVDRLGRLWTAGEREGMDDGIGKEPRVKEHLPQVGSCFHNCQESHRPAFSAPAQGPSRKIGRQDGHLHRPGRPGGPRSRLPNPS